jgi:predicted permease
LIARTLFRLSLFAYPKDVRLEIGASMLRTFEDRMRREPSPALLAKEVFDAVATGLRERRIRSHGPRQEARGRGGTVELFTKDLRHAARSLARSPGFTVVAVLSLALGIGAAAAIFSLVNALLLKKLPVPNPDELVAIYSTRSTDPFPRQLSYPNYRDLWECDRFQSVVGFQDSSMSLQPPGGDPELVWGELVTENFFAGLQVKPALGRTILPEDAHRPVAVLNHDYWRVRFGSDEAVLERAIRINGQEFQVVGVAREGFTGTKLLGFTPDLWVPLTMHEVVWPESSQDADLLERRGWGLLNVRGRMKPGVSLSEAEAALEAIAARLEADHPDVNQGFRLHLTPAPRKAEPIVEAELGNAIPLAGTTLLGIALVVLLVACANVASLKLARTLGRSGELAIRLSLGATRGRLVRQVALESVLLALVSGLAGMWLSDRLLGAALRLGPVLDFSIDYGVETDWRVWSFTAALVFITALFSGILPALRATRGDASLSLKEAGLGQKNARLAWRRLLVIPQIALSLVALVSAGLLIRSFQNVSASEPGFATEGILLASLDPDLRGYDAKEGETLVRSLVERTRAIPDVESATVAFPLPLDAYTQGLQISPEGADVSSEEDEGTLVFYSTVGDDYFEVLETPLVHGRSFEEQDDAGSRPVAIVNETLARRFWPGESAIGKRFGGGGDDVLREVVGVARDGKYLTLGEEPRPYLFLPLRQNYRSPMTLVVKTRSAPRSLEPAVREIARSLDPALPLYGVKTMGEFLGRSTSGPRALALIASFFAAVALTLATVGLYGLMSFTVSQRRHELGIRTALGASRGRVLALFLGQAARVAGIGIVIGLGLAWASTRVMGNLLFGVDAGSPVVFAAVSALLAAATLAGSYVPARRAMRLDPLKALRHE